MNPLIDGQVVNITDGQSTGEDSARRRQGDASSQSLKQRISLTVQTARAERDSEVQKAADRANRERQELERKAKRALLRLLSDDSLNVVIGRHAKLGEVCIGSIKVDKHGIELLRSGGAGAAHSVGEMLDIKFEGNIQLAGKQLKSPEILARMQELQAQGVVLTSMIDASSQAVFITFDYAKALA